MELPDVPQHRLFAALQEDHAKLEERCRALLEEMRAGEAPSRSAEWTRFEEALVAHFEAEEKYLLPAFAAERPDEAEWIRRDHARIRSLVNRLGVGIDLHTVRERTVRELVQSLREHAEREEASFYATAERMADERVRRSVIEQLRGSLL